jgi:hypothetical protein
VVLLLQFTIASVHFFITFAVCHDCCSATALTAQLAQPAAAVQVVLLQFTNASVRLPITVAVQQLVSPHSQHSLLQLFGWCCCSSLMLLYVSPS